MTYYGRWTYKYEIGAEKKAAAVLIVHETEPAAYPFSVVQSKVTEQFDLVAPDKGMSRAAIEGWITLDQARALFAMAGQDFDVLKKQAATREFTPVPLGVTASMTLKSTIRTIDSRNVVGKVEGSDPALKDEYVDLHVPLGPLRHRPGDRRRQDLQRRARQRDGRRRADRAGARLRVAADEAEALAAVPRRSPRRSRACSDPSTTPPPRSTRSRKTVAVINMDALNVYGATSDLTVVGLGAVGSRRLRDATRRRSRSGPFTGIPRPSAAATSGRITSRSRSRACRR